jgi:hypothetical protein
MHVVAGNTDMHSQSANANALGIEPNRLRGSGQWKMVLERANGKGKPPRASPGP